MNNPVYNTRSGGEVIANPVFGATGWMQDEAGSRTHVVYDKGGSGLVDSGNGFQPVQFEPGWVNLSVFAERKKARSKLWQKSFAASQEYRLRVKINRDRGSRGPVGLYGYFDRAYGEV